MNTGSITGEHWVEHQVTKRWIIPVYWCLNNSLQNRRRCVNSAVQPLRQEFLHLVGRHNVTCMSHITLPSARYSTCKTVYLPVYLSVCVTCLFLNQQFKQKHEYYVSYRIQPRNVKIIFRRTETSIPQLTDVWTVNSSVSCRGVSQTAGLTSTRSH